MTKKSEIKHVLVQVNCFNLVVYASTKHVLVVLWECNAGLLTSQLKGLDSISGASVEYFDGRIIRGWAQEILVCINRIDNCLVAHVLSYSLEFVHVPLKDFPSLRSSTLSTTGVQAQRLAIIRRPFELQNGILVLLHRHAHRVRQQWLSMLISSLRLQIPHLYLPVVSSWRQIVSTRRISQRENLALMSST